MGAQGLLETRPEWRGQDWASGQLLWTPRGLPSENGHTLSNACSGPQGLTT